MDQERLRQEGKYTNAKAVAAAKTVKLDDFATPDDNTDLNVSTSVHGLVPKATNAGNYLKDDGTWAAVAGSTPSGTVVVETSFALSGTAGTAATYSRGDHTHGSPTDPVTAHTAAADPHTQYTLSTELTTHEGAVDPHTGYLLESLIDAKGDLIAGSADNTPIKLTVGADNTQLVAATSAASGLKWAAEITTIPYVFGDRTNVVGTGQWGYLPIDFNGTINGWTLIADTAGSIVIDVWKDTYANAPPTVLDSIAASAKPTLSSTVKNASTALTAWTTTVAAGDILGFNVDSSGTVKLVTLSLKVTKTY